MMFSERAHPSVTSTTSNHSGSRQDGMLLSYQKYFELILITRLQVFVWQPWRQRWCQRWSHSRFARPHYPTSPTPFDLSYHTCRWAYVATFVHEKKAGPPSTYHANASTPSQSRHQYGCNVQVSWRQAGTANWGHGSWWTRRWGFFRYMLTLRAVIGLMRI